MKNKPKYPLQWVLWFQFLWRCSKKKNCLNLSATILWLLRETKHIKIKVLPAIREYVVKALEKMNPVYRPT